jgi:glycosyltransferase involved in cell wall biosynthesis
MNSCDVSVIICTYNRATHLLNALKSLCNQTAETQNFEVIVVNNASTDETDCLMKEFLQESRALRIEYLIETKQGSSFARNAGAGIARGKYLCFMDDDAEATPNYIENIMAFFRSTPDAAVLGGRIIPNYVPQKPDWMSHYVSSLVGNFHYANKIQPFRQGHFPFESNLVIEANAFRSVNGFPEHLPGVAGSIRIGGEGKDLVSRILATGKLSYYDPQVVVYHVVEVNKLTPAYMEKVAKGIGAGERLRIHNNGTPSPVVKFCEYCFKLLAAIILGVGYAIQGNPQQTLPIIVYRKDAILGFLQQKIT